MIHCIRLLQMFSQVYYSVGRVEKSFLCNLLLPMYYVYVLQSIKDGMFYTGFTEDLKKRISKHNEGLVTSTKHRRPLRLVYYEGGLHKTDALDREMYLKTAWGKRYIINRIRNYLT